MESEVDREQALICYFKKVKVGKSDECWPCTTSLRGGYGRIYVNHRSYVASRLAFFLFNGHWPKPKCLHRCKQSRSCCNPAHLYEGDDKKNAQDRDVDGTTARGARNGAYTRPDRLRHGECHGRAKVSTEQVIDARARYRSGSVSTVDLAAEFGLDSSSVGDLLLGNSWKHLPGALSSEEMHEIGRAVSRDKHPCGSRHGCAKLSEALVEWVRNQYASGDATQQWLANVLGVTQQTISRVVNYRSYRGDNDR